MILLPRSRLLVVVVSVLAGCNKPGVIEMMPPDPVVPAPVSAAENHVVRLAQPETRPEPPPPPLTALATVSYSPAAARSVNEVSEVTVRVEVRGSEGAHELIANFDSPGSIPYERRAKEIDGSAFDTHVVEFVLPVSGTMIPQQGLSGTWAVALYHDGEKLTAPTFELTP